ncbi:unnamed protein product [Withania somnifera]
MACGLKRLASIHTLSSVTGMVFSKTHTSKVENLLAPRLTSTSQRTSKHDSAGSGIRGHLKCALDSNSENGGEDDQQDYRRWSNGGGTFHTSATIDPSAFVEVGAVVHSECAVGADFIFSYNAALDNCMVGDFCIIHSGVCIGQDGFGFFVDEQGNMVKKPQTLKARIENHVEIGANTCIDRGSWRDTVVGEHTKIDNLVQIGHNVVIGRSCLICGQVGVAGSVIIGYYVTLGGRVGIRDHVSIASKVRLAANSCVTKDISEPGDYGGFPAIPIRDWRRQIAKHRQIEVRILLEF